MAILDKLLLIRQLFVQNIGLNRAFVSLRLSTDRLPALLRSTPRVRRRIVVRIAHHHLVGLPLHHNILLLILHLIYLFLHILLLVTIHGLV